MSAENCCVLVRYVTRPRFKWPRRRRPFAPGYFHWRIRRQAALWPDPINSNGLRISTGPTLAPRSGPSINHNNHFPVQSGPLPFQEIIHGPGGGGGGGGRGGRGGGRWEIGQCLGYLKIVGKVRSLARRHWLPSCYVFTVAKRSHRLLASCTTRREHWHLFLLVFFFQILNHLLSFPFLLKCFFIRNDDHYFVSF